MNVFWVFGYPSGRYGEGMKNSAEEMEFYNSANKRPLQRHDRIFSFIPEGEGIEKYTASDRGIGL